MHLSYRKDAWSSLSASWMHDDISDSPGYLKKIRPAAGIGLRLWTSGACLFNFYNNPRKLDPTSSK